MTHEELESQCAAYREALEYWRNGCSGNEPSISVFERKVDAALSSNAGREYAERLQKVEEERDTYRTELADAVLEQERLHELLRKAEETIGSQRNTIGALTAGCEEYGLDGTTPIVLRIVAMETERDELRERLRKAVEARDAAISLMAEASRELGETQGKLMVSEWPVLDGWMERAQNAEQERDQLRAELERCKADNTHSALREQYQRAVDELERCKKDAERYRFLKDGSRTGSTFIQAYIGGEWCQAREDAADSAIDAAMKEANNG